MKRTRIKRALLFILLLNFSILVFSQKSDSTKVDNYFGGAVTVTNNGISLIPTFTLGKPAVTFDLLIGRKKLSFEPEFQSSLEGKPWGLFFWWRYKLLNTSKLFVRAGAHAALAFSTLPASIDGESRETIKAQRYLAGELCPIYFVSKNISVGTYYLYSYGIDNQYVRNTNFLMFNINISNIKISRQFSLNYMPEIYYLRINTNNGYNITSSLTLIIKNCPVSISGFVNKTLQSNIPGSKNFIWNASLIYSFHSSYVKK
jgi:hypothetical protein